MAKPWAKRFYNSRLWREVRRQVLHRDSYTCHDCGGRATEVHHIVELTPENINDYSVSLNPDNLKSLCYECHVKITQDRTDVPDGYIFNDQGQLVPDTGHAPL